MQNVKTHFAGSARVRPAGLRVALAVVASTLLGLMGSLPASAGTPTVRLNVSAPSTVNSSTFGLPESEGYISVGLILLSGGSLTPPVTVSMTLPEHTSYVAFNGNPAAWNCTGMGRNVSCALSSTLTSANWQSSYLAIGMDVDAALPVPGTSAFEATVSSAELAAPDTGNCVAATTYFGESDNGCLRLLANNFRSVVSIDEPTWSHSLTTFEVGVQNQFTMGFRNQGFGLNNGLVTVNLLLPPGLVYHSTTAVYGGWSCMAGSVAPEGQPITCSVPGMSDGVTSSTSQFTTRVTVTEDVAIPGPVPILATIGNAQQPAPPINSCNQEPLPVGCGYHEIPTQAALLPRMDIIDVTHAPDPFLRGVYGVMSFTVANIGDDVAGVGDFKVALPAGVAFDSVNNSDIPGTVCNTSGIPASGQTVNCSFNAGLPNAGSFVIGLRLIADASAATPARLVAAIGDSDNPGPSLMTCSGDPDAVGCGEHIFDLSPWIFCDGFEAIPRVCGTPQLFP